MTRASRLLLLLLLGMILAVVLLPGRAVAASPGMIATFAQATAQCPDSDGFSQLDPLTAPGEHCVPSEHKHIFAGMWGMDSGTTFAQQLAAATSAVIPTLHSTGWWPQWTYAGAVTGRVLASSVGSNGVSSATARSKGAAFYYRRKGAPNGVAVQPFGPNFGGMILRAGQVINGRLVNAGPDPGGVDDELAYKCGPGDAPNLKLPPATCNTNVLSDVFVFPNCWNGQPAVDQIAAGNMSYPVGSRCPMNFPIVVPRVEQFRRSIIPEYRLGAATLDPQKFAIGGHPVTDLSAQHADYRPAFDPALMDEFLRECINWRNASGVIVGRDCGTNPAILRD